MPADRRRSGGPLPEPTWLPAQTVTSDGAFGLVRDGTLLSAEDYDHAAGVRTIAHVAVAPDGSVRRADFDPRPASASILPVRTPRRLPRARERPRELVLTKPILPDDRGVATLLPGPAVDATLVHADTWWLFATRADLGPNQSLSIWHAPRIRGPWTAHARNPVKVDVRSSRPGGTPFVVDGALFRPAQDGSRRYGGRIVVNRVDVLTQTEFREIPVAAVEPWPGTSQPDGLHTLSAAGDRLLVDGNAMHLVPAALPRTLAARAGRLRADLRRRR